MLDVKYVFSYYKVSCQLLINVVWESKIGKLGMDIPGIQKHRVVKLLSYKDTWGLILTLLHIDYVTVNKS